MDRAPKERSQFNAEGGMMTLMAANPNYSNMSDHWCREELKRRDELARLKREEDDTVKYYLESHITIEPVFDERREAAALLAKPYNFKLAHLLMQKEREATAERSDRDTFMTGHSKSRRDIIERTKQLVMVLKANGFKVWRYKIEDTLIDSRNEDVFGLLP